MLNTTDLHREATHANIVMQEAAPNGTTHSASSELNPSASAIAPPEEFQVDDEIWREGDRVFFDGTIDFDYDGFSFCQILGRGWATLMKIWSSHSELYIDLRCDKPINKSSWFDEHKVVMLVSDIKLHIPAVNIGPQVDLSVPIRRFLSQFIFRRVKTLKSSNSRNGGSSFYGFAQTRGMGALRHLPIHGSMGHRDIYFAEADRSAWCIDVNTGIPALQPANEIKTLPANGSIICGIPTKTRRGEQLSDWFMCSPEFLIFYRAIMCNVQTIEPCDVLIDPLDPKNHYEHGMLMPQYTHFYYHLLQLIRGDDKFIRAFVNSEECHDGHIALGRYYNMTMAMYQKEFEPIERSA